MRPNYPSTACATALIFKAVSEHHAGDTGERMTSNLHIYNWSTNQPQRNSASLRVLRASV
ncbi:MAG: hypothetical protein QNL33_06630 [Akkermansiaceae bacterium]